MLGGMSEQMTVTSGRVVTMHYKLTLDDGQMVDSSQGREPLSYLHGAGNIVPGLESALEGQASGSTLSVKVAPEEGYGQRHPDAVQNVPRGAFPADAKLEVGLSFQAVDENQNPLMGTITALENDAVTVDFNHPLAGLNLNFEIEITEVRDATPEEAEHGHVHGPDGHEH
jgi:FKBP-type peptidyl-prolyl cis-trans isomerase SlyD